MLSSVLIKPNGQANSQNGKFTSPLLPGVMNLSFSYCPCCGLHHRQGVNKHKETQAEVIKASTPKQTSLDVWESVAKEEHAGRDWEGRHSLPLSFPSPCTVFTKLKKPLSPGNRSCATQMVPSYFKWEAEPLRAVVLPVSTDLNLGSSLPSSASLSLSHPRTHTQRPTLAIKIKVLLC